MPDWLQSFLVSENDEKEQWDFRCSDSMSNWTTFRIGGPADLIALPGSINQFISLLQRAADTGIDYEVIGGGSNLIVRDGGIPGLVIVIRDSLTGIDMPSDRSIRVAAGTRLTELARFAGEHGLSGLEFAVGIPGTVGGAIRMNAGAFGAEIGGFISDIEIIDEECRFYRVPAEQIEFSYRSTVLADRPKSSSWWISGAIFKLEPDDPQLIRQRMDAFTRERVSKQPVQFPSAGSIFKRPDGLFPGKLIEECGLKGFRIGRAEVSEQHAGFIINRGGATARDTLLLIEHVQNEVMRLLGVALELEVRIIGVD